MLLCRRQGESVYRECYYWIDGKKGVFLRWLKAETYFGIIDNNPGDIYTGLA